MSKVLSICIPSYNMEKYLSRNLDSFLVADCLDALELIVVNDGSKDSTLQIANDYHTRYPDTVVVIDKPNGHYGSCVNAALKIAQGKYFRIIDADDWVNSDSLNAVISTLEQIETDVFYTRYSVYEEKDNCTAEMEDPFDLIPWNATIDMNAVKFDKYVHMHQITYRLDFLKSINYSQTEGVCYTDTEYVFIPIVQARSLYAMDLSLYQYYVGRNDQSMASNVVSRNFLHFNKVLSRIIDFKKPDIANTNYSFLRNLYINVLLGYMIDGIFTNRCKSQNWNNKLRTIICKLESESFDLSTYFSMTFKGYKWFLWWYKNDLISLAKLRMLFGALQIRLKFSY